MSTTSSVGFYWRTKGAAMYRSRAPERFKARIERDDGTHVIGQGDTKHDAIADALYEAWTTWSDGRVDVSNWYDLDAA